MSPKYKYRYFKICVYIYVAYPGLRMSADRDSPDDIHSAVENKNKVSAYGIIPNKRTGPNKHPPPFFMYLYIQSAGLTKIYKTPAFCV